MLERSYTMIKPDGVQRGLVGQIISRFEAVGLRLVAMKMLIPARAITEQHYPGTPELLKRLGDNTIRGFGEIGKDVVKEFGTNDPIELGKLVREWLMKSITTAPVIAMVWEGNNAIKNIRKLLGSTVPSEALPGTIRGDLSVDSPDVANTEHRSLYNLMHASGNAEEAKFEIGLWFPELKA
jgi:nucleoside-diphosphate kinase